MKMNRREQIHIRGSAFLYHRKLLSYDIKKLRAGCDQMHKEDIKPLNVNCSMVCKKYVKNSDIDQIVN